MVYPALPQGWEAKYEPTSRRWYFINHYTKTTQWEDPRTVQKPAIQQQPNYVQERVYATKHVNHHHASRQRHQPARQPYPVQQQVRLPYPVQRQAGQAYPVQQVAKKESNQKTQLAPVVPPKTIGKSSVRIDKHNFHHQQSETDIASLMNNFDAPKEIARSVLISNPSITKAEEQLKDMGYRKKNGKASFSPDQNEMSPDVDVKKLNQLVAECKVSENLLRTMLDVYENDVEAVKRELGSLTSSGGQATTAVSRRPKEVEADINLLSTLSDVYGANKYLVKSLLQEHSNDVQIMETELKKRGFTKSEDFLKRSRSISSKFPETSANLIEEQLIKSSNSEGIVCRTLENLGYKRSRKMAEAETSKTFVNNKEVETILEDKGKDELEIAWRKESLASRTEELLMSVPDVVSKDTSVDDGDSSLSIPCTKTVENGSRTASSPHTPSSSSLLLSFSSSKPETTQTKFNEIPNDLWRNDSEYRSAIRLQPKGPNPSLPMGPNPTLLLLSRASPLGPDRKKYKGAQKTNVRGINLANCKGPAGLANGPSVRRTNAYNVDNCLR